MKTALSFLFVAVFACGSMTACDGAFGSSKIAHGEPYTSGDSRYDSYFESVHQQQASKAKWDDEKKAARRPLVFSLVVTPASSDSSLLSAMRDRVKKMGGGGAKLDLAGPRVTRLPGTGSDNGLFGAVEETARGELDRARRLRASSDHFEELAKQGEAHKRDADHEFENRGAAKADEKKTEKQREVRRELSASISALRSLARDARDEAEDADEFLDDLGHALEGNEAPRDKNGKKPKRAAPPPPPPKADEPKDDKKGEDSKPKAPSKKPTGGKPDKSETKPAPAQDEVFNP